MQSEPTRIGVMSLWAGHADKAVARISWRPADGVSRRRNRNPGASTAIRVHRGPEIASENPASLQHQSLLERNKLVRPRLHHTGRYSELRLWHSRSFLLYLHHVPYLVALSLTLWHCRCQRSLSTLVFELSCHSFPESYLSFLDTVPF